MIEASQSHFKYNIEIEKQSNFCPNKLDNDSDDYKEKYISS